MKKALLRISLLCLFATAMGVMSVKADGLTPEEALARATASELKRAHSLRGSERMTLAMTESDTKGRAAVYVFNRPSGGFLVLAADDKVGDIVLGYSDDSLFDPTNMPPAMKALLAGYAEYIENFDFDSDSDFDFDFDSDSDSDSELGTLNFGSKAPQKAARQDIAPLVQTKWNQLAPYNNNCPLVGGSRCVTGCVATATAQVMKYHNWPDRGVGSYTHTFETASGETVTTTADFGNTTYDWAHMTNTYGNSSTDTEKAAVATLMHHCGVMSHMNYSPGESGTSDFLAGQGLLKYLKYDRGMRYLRKAWFTEEEWSAVFYEQMAASQPIILGGNTSAGYHELVVDGYRVSDGFFHFNWGWGGASDGYFSIKSTGSFGPGQTVLCDVKPDAGSPLTVAMGMMADVKTDKGDYLSDEDITFIGAICSYALDNITVDLGLKFTGEDGSQVIPMKSNQTIEPSYGDGSFKVNASALSTLLPTGEYDVEYVYSTDGGQTWQTAYYDKSLENGARARLLITPYYVMSYTFDEKEANLEAFTEGIAPVNEADGNAIYAGHDYDFTFGVKTSIEWEGELACLLMDGSNNVITTSERRKVTIKDDREKLTFRMTMPATTGTYNYALGYADGEGWEICSDIAQVRIHEALAENAFAQPAYILNVDRGYLPSDAESGKAVISTTAGNAGRYALLQLPDKEGQYYLYNTDNGKFVKSADFDNTHGFLANPDGAFTLTKINNSDRYIIASVSKGNYLQFGGANQLLVGSWKTLDRGNQWTIAEAGMFDATEVYTKLGWVIPTSVDNVTAASVSHTVYNLSGQAVKPSGRGLYIVSGKKVILTK